MKPTVEDWEATPEPEQANRWVQHGLHPTSSGGGDGRQSHTSVKGPSKKHHTNVAAQAIQRFEATVVALPQALAKAMNPDSPVSQRQVLSNLAKEDWLLPQQKVTLSVLFCKDTALCDQYIAWAGEQELQQMWIWSLLDSENLLMQESHIPAPSF